MIFANCYQNAYCGSYLFGCFGTSSILSKLGGHVVATQAYLNVIDCYGIAVMTHELQSGARTRSS